MRKLSFAAGIVRSMAALAVALAAIPALAQSGSVLISPVDPTIGAKERATALWLENPGKAPIQLQIRVFAWSQSETGDMHAAQSDVIGTPPMVRIEPGQRQLVRLTRTQPVPAGAERAFRVIVDEIPLPDARHERADNARIQFRMRYALPLFTYGAGLARPKTGAAAAVRQALDWRIVTDGGMRLLEMRNSGPVHARLVNAQFVGDKTPFSAGLLGYVLAGSTMRWPLPNGVGSGPLRLTVNGEAMTLDPRSGG